LNFDTFSFGIFLTIVLVGSYAFRSIRIHQFWLLGASYFFYGFWDWRLLAIIIAITLVSFYAGQMLTKHRYFIMRRRLILSISLFLLLLPLGVFKYLDFFADSFSVLVAIFGFDVGWVTINIILPIGISFYTFQAISYVIDISRNEVDYEENLYRYALFIAFFPQLVAGPIMRAKTFLPQLQQVPELPTPSQFYANLCRFFWGLLKKVLIADRLALALVDPVFNDPGNYSAVSIGMAIFGFGLLIYADFSGYSDMAIGISRMLGYRLQENFLAPYTARSIREFWRRWHVSLSSWIRDYLYIPLGGSRSKTSYRRYANLLFTMMLIGLWHGAAWTFVLWGGVHGLALVIERIALIEKFRGETFFHSVGAWVWTMFVVYSGWLIFRVEDIAGLNIIVQAISQNWLGPLPPKALMGFLAVVAIVLYGEQLVIRKLKTEEFSSSSLFDLIHLNWSYVTISLIVFILILAQNPEIGQRNFVYFQF
jgi:alginate O-acetyltransferase complex protein AlgI